jgi:hypothetical protein
MKTINLILIAITLSTSTLMAQNSQTEYVKISQKYLYAIKTEETAEADSLKTILAHLPFDKLVAQLQTDNQKFAFWLNIYNASVQYFLSKDATMYKSRSSFFGKKQIDIAGKVLSLEQIEHGILRRSRNKYLMGYVGVLFESATIKALRVAKPDYRIHFALNCGASSCPPIAFYDDQKLEAQFTTAEKFFIPAITKRDTTSKTIKTSKILSWFRADFGGKAGIRKLLVKYDFKEAENWPIVFEEYDWSLELTKYAQ